MLRALGGRAAGRTEDGGTWDAPADGEAALVARAREDPEAFGLLYDRYVDDIFAFCYRRLGAREAAEDATSQVFTNALAALPRYRERDGAFRSWLFSIAFHVVSDGFREQRRRPSASLDSAASLADPEPSPEDLAIAADQKDVLAWLLAQLTGNQRRIIELRLAGLSGDEIARILGRTRNAVDVAQHRAIKRLRRLLASHTAQETPRAP